MRSIARRLHRDESGVALAIVMLLGSILVLISVVIVNRAARQVGTVNSDTRWDQALHVAESGIDVGLVSLEGNESWTTGETVPAGKLGSSDEGDWAVEVADARAASTLGVTPEGEYAVIKPSNAAVIYGVGFVPSRDAIGRRVRVVRVTLDQSPASITYQANRSFLTNEELEIIGNPTFHGVAASAHSNANVTVPGNPTFQDGCLTASTGGTVTGNLNVHASCPSTSTRFTQPTQYVPEIVPRNQWGLSEYDMCPDGKVRAGPGHPTLGATAGTAPCTTGTILSQSATTPYRGWKYTGCCSATEGAGWTYDTNTAYDGAYYFYQGTVRIPNSPGTNNNPWMVTIIAEASGSCPNNVGGDVFLSGSMALAPYTAGSKHSGNGFAVLSGRDVDWSGNGKLLAPGVVAAREQISIGGNVDVDGAFIAEGKCNTATSTIQKNSISGNPTFRLDGPIGTGWTILTGQGGLAIVGWDEL